MNRFTSQFADSHYVIRAVWTCHHWHQFIQIYFDCFQISCIRIGRQRLICLFSAHGFQEFSCNFITWEYRCGCAQFCTHIGDGCTFRNAQCFYTVAGIFINFINAAFYGFFLQHIQNNIFCGYARTQFACQTNLDYFRHLNVIAAASHSSRYVYTAGTDCQHTQTACGWCVAVRTD